MDNPIYFHDKNILVLNKIFHGKDYDYDYNTSKLETKMRQHLQCLTPRIKKNTKTKIHTG